MNEATLLDMYMMALIASGYYNRDDFGSFMANVRRDAERIIAGNARVGKVAKRPISKPLSGYTPTPYPGTSNE